MTPEKVCYDELLPHEFRQRMAARPIAYLPLGTLEWHGEHLPLGSDAIISEGIMVSAARRLGGIVLPPIHLGPDRSTRTEQGHLQGMDYVAESSPNRPLDGSCYWVSEGLFAALVDAVLEQIARAGFRGVFADGHGPSRGSWVRHIEDREARFGLKLLGVDDRIKAAWPSQMDHAARNETSLVMAIRPALVDLSRLSADRDVWPVGVDGEDPRDATAAHGESCLARAVELLQVMFREAGL